MFAVLRQASIVGNRKKNNTRARRAATDDDMYGYGYNYSHGHGQSALEQISPPSSPEWNATQTG
jgi:hypothetical protein